jgi:O-antigen ligase
MSQQHQHRGQTSPSTSFLSFQTLAGFRPFQINLVELLLIGSLFFVPFLIPRHTYPLTSFWLEEAAFLLFTSFMLIFSFRRVPREHEANGAIFSHVFVVGLVGILLVTVTQWSLGMLLLPEQVIWPVIYFITAMVSLMIGVRFQAQTTAGYIEKLVVGCIFFVWLMNFVLVTIQNLGWNFTGFGFVFFDNGANTPGGFLSQRNQMCVLTMMAWVCLMLPSTLRWMPKPFFWVLYLIIPATLVITKGRTGLAILLVMVVFFLFAQWRQVIKRNWFYSLLVVGTLLLYAGQTFVFNQLTIIPQTDRGDALSRAANVGEYYSRYYTQMDALSMTAKRPLIGVGAGNFIGQRYRDNEISAVGKGLNAQSNIAHTHNLFTQLLVEWGVVGFLCVFIPLMWWLGSILRRIWQGKMTSPQFCATSVMLVIGIYAMLEYPHWYGFFLIPFMFLMGISGGGIIKINTPAYQQLLSQYFRYIAVLFSALSIGLCLWIGKAFSETESLFMTLQTSGRVAGMRMQIDDSLKTPFFLTEKYYLTTIYMDPALQASQRNREVLEKTISRLPYPDVIGKLIILYLKEGRLEKAIYHAKKLAKWDAARYEDFYKQIQARSIFEGGNFLEFLDQAPPIQKISGANG